MLPERPKLEETAVDCVGLPSGGSLNSRGNVCTSGRLVLYQSSRNSFGASVSPFPSFFRESLAGCWKAICRVTSTLELPVEVKYLYLVLPRTFIEEWSNHSHQGNGGICLSLNLRQSAN